MTADASHACPSKAAYLLPYEPRAFRDVVEADLRRAGRLIVREQDELDPQVRAGTPSGYWALAVTRPDTKT